jgi:hypothetical protein
MDKWLKRIWLVNGILLLVAFGMIFSSDIASRFHRSRYHAGAISSPIVGSKLEKARADTLALQDVTISLPSRIGKTKYSYMSVVAKDLTKPVRMKDSSPEPAGEVHCISIPEDRFEATPWIPRINLVFMSDDGTDVRLLLKEKAAIVRTQIPSSQDTTDSFILYRIVFRDSNGDGLLTWDDDSVPYISDLDGRNLHPLVPDSIDVTAVDKSFRDNELFISGLIRPKDAKVPKADWPETLFKYDIAARRLSPILRDDKVLDEARRMLQMK